MPFLEVTRLGLFDREIEVLQLDRACRMLVNCVRQRRIRLLTKIAGSEGEYPRAHGAGTRLLCARFLNRADGCGGQARQAGAWDGGHRGNIDRPPQDHQLSAFAVGQAITVWPPMNPASLVISVVIR